MNWFNASNAVKFLLIVLSVGIGAVLIGEGAEVLAWVGSWVMSQFSGASLNPNSSGFGNSARLIILAFFVGWCISRIKRIRRK